MSGGGVNESPNTSTPPPPALFTLSFGFNTVVHASKVEKNLFASPLKSRDNKLT